MTILLQKMQMPEQKVITAPDRSPVIEMNEHTKIEVFNLTVMQPSTLSIGLHVAFSYQLSKIIAYILLLNTLLK